MTAVPVPPPSPALQAFMGQWQPRQRRTAGLLSSLFVRLDALTGAHPSWSGYDLLTHTLAGLHLVIENDRLSGGHTRQQTVDELRGLVAAERPDDQPERHLEIAGALVDLLINARDRHMRIRDRYLRLRSDGRIEHPEQSFQLVRTVGEDETREPTLRATPEAINLFQNLYEFDPSDRAAAERYRSERMLQRQDYDEVSTSVERRATGVFGMREELVRLLNRIRFNVRDVDYRHEVIPLLDDAIDAVGEQVDAEERFAAAVAQHLHAAAPDHTTLRRISAELQGLIRALTDLQGVAATVRSEFEQAQDRQLFTYRRMTINPRSELLQPVLERRPTDLDEFLPALLAQWLGVRHPRLLNLQAVMDRIVGSPVRSDPTPEPQPFRIGNVRGVSDDLDPVVVGRARALLDAVDAPTRLSALLEQAAEDDGILDDDQRSSAEWLLAVAVASAYGGAEDGAGGTAGSVLDGRRLAVVHVGAALRSGPVRGDDLVVIPIQEAVG